MPQWGRLLLWAQALVQIANSFAQTPPRSIPGWSCPKESGPQRIGDGSSNFQTGDLTIRFVDGTPVVWMTALKEKTSTHHEFVCCR